MNLDQGYGNLSASIFIWPQHFCFHSYLKNLELMLLELFFELLPYTSVKISPLIVTNDPAVSSCC